MLRVQESLGRVSLHLTAIGDDDLSTRLPAAAAQTLQLLDQGHALDDFAKHNLTAFMKGVLRCEIQI
jgi:hypothetical protein